MNRDENEQVLDIVLSEHAEPSVTGWLRINCPFCEYKLGRVDRNICLGVYGPTGFWHCFRCATKGKLSKTDMDALGFSEEDFELHPTIVHEKPEGFIPLYEEPGLSSVVLRPAKNYLTARGVTLSMLVEFQIGACLDGDYAYRVVIPILDEKAEWKGFVARDWSGRQAQRYDNSTGLERNKYFFNHKELLRKTKDPLFVVEGIFDAFRLYPNVVALLGKPSDNQREMLCEVDREIIVCLDGDARRESWALAQLLCLEGKNSTYIELPPKTDPGSLTKEEIMRLL